MALSTADRVALLDLYSRSVRLIDDGDNERWAALFTADGVFERKVSPMPGIEAVRIEGAAALAEFGRGVRARGAGRHRHWLSGILLDGSAEEADGSCYFAVLDAAGPGRTTILGTGVYRDRWVRDGAGWRLHYRLAVPDR
jgi:3-phenylpropionate/cinnamic acid dioxygenase small subunit